MLCLLALAVLVLVAIAVGLRGGRGEPDAVPTTGAYAPITVPKPLVPRLGYGGPLVADPDSMIRQGQDLQTVVTSASAPHHYRLTITNVSNIGFIGSFQWYPPSGVSIVKLLGSSSGHCVVAGTAGLGGKLFQNALLNPEITCDNLNLKPPTCTCKGDGGEVVISLVADRDIGLAGSTRVVSATPVLSIIPSSVQTPDVPSCASGQVSTTAKPCTPTG